MKIQFIKSVDIDVWNHSLNETYPKYIKKWSEFHVETIDIHRDMKKSDIILYNGDILKNVPIDTYTEKKSDTVSRLI